MREGQEAGVNNWKIDCYFIFQKLKGQIERCEGVRAGGRENTDFPFLFSS